MHGSYFHLLPFINTYLVFKFYGNKSNLRKDE